jgi:hypothetical protein
MPAPIATPASNSMEGDPMVDGVELHEADENQINGDDVVQEPRDKENKDSRNNGDKRRDMGGGDDHGFASGVLGEKHRIGTNGARRRAAGKAQVA